MRSSRPLPSLFEGLWREILAILPLALSMASSDDFAFRSMAFSGLMDQANPDPNQPAANIKILVFFQLLVASLSPAFSTNLNATPFATKLKALPVEPLSEEDKTAWRENEAAIFRVYQSSLLVSVPPMIAIMGMMFWTRALMVSPLCGQDPASSELAQDFTRPFALVAVPATFIEIDTVQLIYIFQKTRALNLATLNWIAHLLFALGISRPETGLSSATRSNAIMLTLTSQIVSTAAIYLWMLRQDPLTKNLCDPTRLLNDRSPTLWKDAWDFFKAGAPITGAVGIEILNEVFMGILVGKLSLTERDAYSDLVQTLVFSLPFEVHTSLAGMITCIMVLSNSVQPSPLTIKRSCLAAVLTTLLVNSLIPTASMLSPQTLPILLKNNAPEVQAIVTELQPLYSMAVYLNALSFIAMYLLRALGARWESTAARVGSLTLAMLLMATVSKDDLRSLSWSYCLGMVCSCTSLLVMLYKRLCPSTPTVAGSRGSLFAASSPASPTPLQNNPVFMSDSETPQIEVS